MKPAELAGLDLVSGLDNLTGRIDYPTFVMKVLGFDFPEIHDPRVQEHMARIGAIFRNWTLTRHQQKVFRKVLDCRPRGSCKTATATIPLIPYAHLHDPEIAAALMSASYEKMALKFSSAIRSVWDGESPDSRLAELYGSFKPTGRSRDWSANKMVTSRRQNLAHADPTLATYSIKQGPTSGHFKLFVIDDPITEEMMENDRQWLDKAWGAYNRMNFVLDNDALLYLIMTRYHDADLVGRIIQEEIEPEVRKRIQLGAPEGQLPKDFDAKTGWIKYAHLAGWEVHYDAVYENYNPAERRGDVLYPVIWPVERIEASRKTDVGETQFWSQLMNQPARRDNQPVTQEMVDRAFLPNLQSVPKRALKTIDIHCDFSFKSAEAFIKGSGDWCVAHVCAKDGGYIFRSGGYRGKPTQKGFGEELMKLVAWVYHDLGAKVRYITYDQLTGHGSGDESTRLWLHQLFMANPDLPRAAAYPIKRQKGAGVKKLQRIMDSNWVWQEGYMVLVEEAPFNDPLIYQVLNQGYTEHDDDIDALCDATHEGLYKRTRAEDLPADVENISPQSRHWTPVPAVHGHFDRDTGKFKAEFRSARTRVGEQNALTRAAFGKR